MWVTYLKKKKIKKQPNVFLQVVFGLLENHFLP